MITDRMVFMSNKKRIVSAALVIIIVILSFPVSAAGSPAYNTLAEQEPVFQRELTLSGLEEYYYRATTDELLDPSENNYTYGEVSVGGVAELCHVYMRTFLINDLSDLSVNDLEALAKRIVSFVKASASEKYLKCIAKTYNARISGVTQREDGRVDSVTVKIFIACGEKTEDRAALKSGYIAGLVSSLRPLDDGERFLRMNELILDGRFRYDMSYRHRCSAVALVADGMGVCEEYAGFTSLLLDALGYENYIITGTVGSIPHMWNLVRVDGRLYHLDILHDGPVDENGVHTSAERTFLLVSEKTVMATHTPAEQYAHLSSQAENDYVFDGYPESIPETVEGYGDRYLSPAKLMTAAALSEMLGCAGFLTFARGDAALAPEDIVGTGCTVSLYVNGRLLDSCGVSVKGDVNGDGDVTDADAESLASALLSADPGALKGVFASSADSDGSGPVTITDLIILEDQLREAANENNGAEEILP